jgi:hypothetical protein
MQDTIAPPPDLSPELWVAPAAPSMRRASSPPALHKRARWLVTIGGTVVERLLSSLLADDPDDETHV